MSMINDSSEEQIDQGASSHKCTLQQVLEGNQYAGVNEAPGFLARLWRQLLIERRITVQKWSELMDAYLTSRGLKGREGTAVQDSLVKALGSPDMTERTFLKGLQVLGITSAVMEISCTSKDDKVTICRTPLGVIQSVAIYQVEPCRQIPGTEPHESRSGVERCDLSQAQFFGVYRRPVEPDSEGRWPATWVSDHPTRAGAEAEAARLMGQ